MNIFEFKHLITNAKYNTKYEPIIDLNTNEVFAYEALSSFDIDNRLISTENIFRKLHQNNDLFNLEKRNKYLQVKHFDLNSKLLNFDADIVISEEQQKYWAEFLIKHKDYIVVEITENGSDDETSSEVMRNFSLWLKEKNIETALDDFAQEGSMFSFLLWVIHNILKLINLL